MSKIMVVLFMFITGCNGFPQYASNTEIVAEKQICVDAGMDYAQDVYYHVYCVHPKKEFPK